MAATLAQLDNRLNDPENEHIEVKEVLVERVTLAVDEGVPLQGLLPLFPALAECSVQRLLAELATERSAQSTGRGRAARWFPGKAQARGSTVRNDPSTPRMTPEGRSTPQAVAAFAARSLPKAAPSLAIGRGE